MTSQSRFSRGLRVVEDVLAYVAGAAALVIMVLTIIDVIGRALFRTPLFGAYETIEGFLLGFVVWLGIAQAARLDQHVAVGVLVQRFSARAQSLIALIPLLATTAMFGFIAVATLQRAVDRWYAVTESAIIPLPNGAAWLGVGLGSAAIAVRLAVTAVHNVHTAYTQPADADHHPESAQQPQEETR